MANTSDFLFSLNFISVDTYTILEPMNNYLKEIKAILIFALAVGLLFGTAFVIGYFKIETYFYAGILGYIVLCALLALLGHFIPSTFMSRIARIVLMPGEILLIFVVVLLPFGILVIHVVFYFGLVLLIPVSLVQGADYLGLELFKNPSTRTYFQYTAAVFIAVLLNFQLRQFLYRVSPARIGSSQKLKPYGLDKLTDYVLSEKNIRFLIYGLYVVLLLVINFQNFENEALTAGLFNDRAILQSFVTFIAFDRMLVLLKQLDFKPSDLLDKIGKSIRNKLNEWEKPSEK